MIMDSSSIYDKRCCYDAHLFLEPPQHDIICCVDGRVAKDAVRSRACGHVYGMQCILEYLVNHEICPKCGVSLDCTMLEPSEIIRTHIMRSAIRCPTGPSHCEWQGPMAEMMVHLHSSQCGVPRTQCPFCHQRFDTHVFESQHKAECLAALVLCPYCDDAVERGVMAQHKQECAAVAAAAKKKKDELAIQDGKAKGQTRKGGPATSRNATATSGNVANRRTATTSRIATGNSTAKKTSKNSKSEESDQESGTLTPSTAQKMKLLVQQQQNNNNNNNSRRPSSAAPVAFTNNHNTNMSRPLSSGIFQQNQQHELSLRSPIGSAATRRLLDESAFQLTQNNNQFQNQVRALSPGQLQQWRTMTSTSTRSVSNNNNNNNNSQLISYSSSSMNNNNNNPLEAFQQDISTLIQELSRVGQKCQNLEMEVETLKRSNSLKDGQINILSMQLKKVEEQVVQLMNAGKNKKDEMPEDTFSIEADTKSKASANNNNLLPRRPQKSVVPSSAASTAVPPPSSREKTNNNQSEPAGPNYSSRNKNYKEQQPANNNETYKLPADVMKEVRRTSQAEDINSLVRSGLTPQTNTKK